MSLLRLLPVALLATPFTLQANAQAAPKIASVIPASPRALTAMQAYSFEQGQPEAPHNLLLKKTNPALTAQLNAPCATLRVYGFTPQDLKSDSPHASRYTTSTSAASNGIREIQTTPATVTAIKVVPSHQ